MMKKNKMPKNSVCIIGLGFVGLTLAVIMAKKGFKVYGVEKNKFILEQLKHNKSHFYEPGINNELKKIIKVKKFVVYSKIPKKNDINTYIITVGTPLNKNKKINTEYISSACRQLSKLIKDEDCVILRSTVKIGTSRNIVGKILSKTKKKFKLAYCPERAVEGAAMKELNFLPQIIGGIDNVSVNFAKKIFNKITKKIVLVSSLETAEMVKLIDNSSRDVFFAYANEIARVCDSIGLDANEIINSGKKNYNRTFLASPGLVGGPCLHKDPYILSESLKKNKIKTEITLMARKINERQPFEIVKFIKTFLNKKSNFPKKLEVSVLGLAFKGKPITDDIRGSMSLKVIESIKKSFFGSRVYGFDPTIKKSKIKKNKIYPLQNIKNAFKGKNLILITNNHKYFSKMNLKNLSKNLKKPALIYDFWNHFSSKDLKLPKEVTYITLGNHSSSKN